MIALRRLAAGLTFGIAVMWGACAEADELHLIPRPARVAEIQSCRGPALDAALTVPAGLERGALEIVDERWRALGIPALRTGAHPRVRVAVVGGAPEGYRLAIGAQGVRIAAADGDGTLHAFATLAQPGAPDDARLRTSLRRDRRCAGVALADPLR